MNQRHILAATVIAIHTLIAGCGGGGSDPAPPKNPPAVSSQPANVTALTGATATFTVTATGTGLSYQWKKNGVDIPGATAAAYTTPPVSYLDSAAQYTVVVSNADGSVTSSAAQLNLALSANQQIAEDLILAPASGSFLLHWNLNLAGAQVTGTNYAFSEFSVLAASPLTHGPQQAQQSNSLNMPSTLALRPETPTRILKNGVVLVVPAALTNTRTSYVGNDIQVDFLADDNTTVAYTQIRSDYTSVSLNGTMAGVPTDFAQWHNSWFANPAILNGAATFSAGAGYIKFTATNKGDRYNAFDCNAATFGANISPCAFTTLQTALTTGLVSNSDGKTYHLADGVVSTVGGIPVWVANTVRPPAGALSSTVQYRIYFELNGNVYTGALIRDGATLGGSSYVSNPAGVTPADRLTFLPFHIRMNQAARDSMTAALKI